MKFKTKKRTIIEAVFILMVLAIFLIVVVPNSFNAMNSNEQNSMKKYAKKMFNEAETVYKNESSSKKHIGYKGSKFKWVDYDKYAIKIKDLDSKDSKYKGCVLINTSNDKFIMSIYLYDGKLMYDGVLKDGLNAKDIPSKDIVKPKNDEEVISNIGKYLAT